MQEKEPETHGAPLRRFTDPAYVPLCANLAEVRENIDGSTARSSRCWPSAAAT
jgi:hypothetical protein